MEYQSLQTVEARIRVGIGRRHRIRSIRSTLRDLNSVIIYLINVETVRKRKKKKKKNERERERQRARERAI